MRILAVLPLLALTAAAPAPPAPDVFRCDGQMAILYHNKVKEGGSLEGIADAAKAQESWYRAHGVTTNRIVLAKVVAYDGKTKQSSYATDEVFTLHLNPPAADRTADGAKPDFIEKYKANATVLEKKTICLPKL